MKGVYDEMCEYFSNNESALRKFINFYDNYGNDRDFLEIFNREYGDVYEVIKKNKQRIYNKAQTYDEMCKFLAYDKNELIQFKQFYEKSKNSNQYNKLFQDNYGDTYCEIETDKLKQISQEGVAFNARGNELHTTISDESNFRQDIKIIRQWVQFFGWVTVVGLVISVIAGIAIGLSAS